MTVYDTILEAIGDTPLVRLRKLVGPKDATVLCKCEFMNPGGSDQRSPRPPRHGASLGAR